MVRTRRRGLPCPFQPEGLRPGSRPGPSPRPMRAALARPWDPVLRQIPLTRNLGPAHGNAIYGCVPRAAWGALASTRLLAPVWRVEDGIFDAVVPIHPELPVGCASCIPEVVLVEAVSYTHLTLPTICSV